MLKAAAGPAINWDLGSVQEVDAETGQALIADGAAVALDAPDEIESAMVDPGMETAVVTRRRKSAA
jgi:hypothetical protein